MHAVSVQHHSNASTLPQDATTARLIWCPLNLVLRSFIPHLARSRSGISFQAVVEDCACIIDWPLDGNFDRVHTQTHTRTHKERECVCVCGMGMHGCAYVPVKVEYPASSCAERSH